MFGRRLIVRLAALLFMFAATPTSSSKELRQVKKIRVIGTVVAYSTSWFPPADNDDGSSTFTRTLIVRVAQNGSSLRKGDYIKSLTPSLKGPPTSSHCHRSANPEVRENSCGVRKARWRRRLCPLPRQGPDALSGWIYTSLKRYGR